MRLIAGLDVGNSTTELVLAELQGEELIPRWFGRQPTRGPKGSSESLDGAAALLERAEGELQQPVEAIALTQCSIVHTTTVDVRREAPVHAPIGRIDSDGATPAGIGIAAGAHRQLASLEATISEGDIVVSVPADVDFEDAASIIRARIADGWPVVGVLAGGDDAVLISNRLPVDIPIIDEASVGELVEGERVAIEVAPEGQAIRRLSDPLALMYALELAGDQAPGITELCRSLADSRSVAVVARPSGPAAYEGGIEPELVAELDGACRRLDIRSEVGIVRSLPLGAARELVLAGSSPSAVERHRVSDVYAVDLGQIDDGAWLRRGVASLDAIPLAALLVDEPIDAEPALEELTGRRTISVGTEPLAGAAGATTTPKCPPGAGVCDLGGGTIDMSMEGRSVVVAGAGELVTSSVATALGIPRGLAEYAKRRSASRVEAPQLVHEEDGGRRLLARPVASSVLGRLCVEIDGELLPFSDRLAPEEWRSLRLAIKREVIGANVERCLQGLPEMPGTLLLAGGVACDAELVRIVADRLRPFSTTVARANVAGRLGPRYAVAFGALRMWVDQSE